MSYVWNDVGFGQASDATAINGLGDTVTAHDVAIASLQAAQLVHVDALKTVATSLPGPNAGFNSDPDLRCGFAPFKNYYVKALIIQNAAVAAGFHFEFVETSAGGVTGHFDVVTTAVGGSALSIQKGGIGVPFTSAGAAADADILIEGRLSVGVNAGTLLISWGQNTGNASATLVQPFSYLTIYQM